MSLGPGLGLGTQRGWGDRTKHPRVPCRTSSCLQEGSGGPSLPLIVCPPSLSTSIPWWPREVHALASLRRGERGPEPWRQPCSGQTHGQSVPSP